jgi:2-oxoacid dehydrogenases acyltransferase (catalytic domain)
MRLNRTNDVVRAAVFGDDTIRMDTSPRVVPGARSVTGTSLRRRGRRDRVALITWPRSRDAKIGCTVRLEWDRVTRAHANVTPVAIVGFGLAQAFTQNPMANRRVVLWSIRRHKTVRLSFAIDAGDDLKVAVVDHADTFDPRQLQRALSVAAREARRGVGPLARATRLIEHVPVGLGRPAVRLWSLLTAGFGISLFGVPGTPFGAALISSVERFKLPAADVPFVPFTRCALVCSVGTVTPSVLARGGAAVVVDTVDIAVTFDHRICDASQLASMLQCFEAACYGG